MSLIIKCQEHYEKVVAYAEANGIYGELTKSLDYLDKLAGEGTCYLYFDFAPNCFEFEIVNGGKRVMNGGLILHTDIDPHPGKWHVHT